MTPRTVVGLIALALLAAVLLVPGGSSMASDTGQGALTIIEQDGKPAGACPLEHTSVKAEISGFVARVSVSQIFINPRKEKIEAIYTFPLSAEAAVDDMLMKVGDRTVRGTIKRREEARQIYEQAKQKGHVASLLDQERPNIFTQSVANIMPGNKVEITVQYVEILPYNDGAFSFVFPMVVGPRFIPGKPVGQSGTGWAPDTAQVPDASRITPPVTPEGTRAGHDIDVTVSIDAGVSLVGIDSKLHQVDVARKGTNAAAVSLKNQKEIPNRDFILTYTVAGDEVKSGVLTHKDGKAGFVTIIMIPPKRAKPEQIAPKEMIFVIDCSGSQHGLPLEKAKDAMRYFVDHMHPEDTFNIIDFNVNTRALFSEPKKNSPETRAKALKYLESLQAQGGTWMGPAVEQVCKTPAPENRLRIVTFMTDGYVGNDLEIISLVQKHRGRSRWFPFGTGNSINRFLIDQMARVGGGESEVITLSTPGAEVGKRFYDRIANPVLTDASLSVAGISLEEIYPKAVSDLWDRKPLVFKARYEKAGKGTVTITGFSGGKPYEQKLDVTLPEKEAGNASLASLWARAKVDDLMDRDWLGIQHGTPKPEIKDAIVSVALEHRIMTQYTSFVAVDESVVTPDGKPTTVPVPVEMPDGVSREGVFGKEKRAAPGQVPSKTHANAVGRVAPGGAPSAPPPKRPSEAPMPATQEMAAAPRRQDKDSPVGFRDRRLESDSRAQLSKEEAETKPKSRADGKQASLSPKLAADLRELIEVAAKKDAKASFVHGKIAVKGGKVTVLVRLTDLSESILKRLQDLGFMAQAKDENAKTVTGAIRVETLEELVKMDAVIAVEAAPEA